MGISGSAITFRLPLRAIWGSTIAGVLGWEISVALTEYVHITPVYGSMIGAFVTSVCCESLARALRMPATVFILPAIMAIVPGRAIYESMLNLVHGNHPMAVSCGMQAMLIASGIAVGMLFGTAISKGIINPNLQHLHESIKDDFAISIPELFDEGEERKQHPTVNLTKKEPKKKLSGKRGRKKAQASESKQNH